MTDTGARPGLLLLVILTSGATATVRADFAPDLVAVFSTLTLR